MAFETTSSRLWKHLSAEDRRAASLFFSEPSPEVVGMASARPPAAGS